jgi:hypothetical protein
MGLAPKETLSGFSVKGKPRLCEVGHVRLRKALYMPALVSIQCNLVMIAFYNRLKEKGKKWKSFCLCDYAETGPHYFWYFEIRQKIRFKL